jgi:transcriptional regulator with XRE-family HTH domain
MWGIEQGARNPSLRHVARLATALGVPLGTLFRDM